MDNCKVSVVFHNPYYIDDNWIFHVVKTSYIRN